VLELALLVKNSTAAAGHSLVDREIHELSLEMKSVDEEVAQLQKSVESSIRDAEQLFERIAQFSRWIAAKEEQVAAFTNFDLSVPIKQLTGSCEV
jgi:chromosome segregation ATPase